VRKHVDFLLRNRTGFLHMSALWDFGYVIEITDLKELWGS
jgi:hypothetical protein